VTALGVVTKTNLLSCIYNIFYNDKKEQMYFKFSEYSYHEMHFGKNMTNKRMSVEWPKWESSNFVHR